ncbi:MAG: AsmA family protein, partial [Rickettsiales bacterium]|nr:AsmA family protein [Rickettsiales bacterium]
MCVAIIYWVALQALINTDAVRERLSASLKEQTGAVLEVQQTALSVFPLPSVILRRVSIVNSTQSNESYFFEAESITFRLGLSSIFESQPKFSEVKLRKPRLSLERYSLQEANWTGFLALFKNMNGVAIDKMTVMDGLITYRDASNEQLQSLDKLQGQVQWRAGALTSARLGFSVFDTASEFSLSTSGVTISAYDHFTMQADALLRVGKDYAGYKGALAQMPGQPLIGQGSIQIEAQHARQWMERLFSAEKKLGAFAAITKDMPLHLQANLNSRADRGTLALQDLSLGESKGKVNVSWLVQPTKTQAKVEAIFEQLSIDQVLGDKDGNPSHFLTVFLPEGVEANITAQIKKMPFNQVPISDVKFTASLSDGEMNINQLLLALPGRTRGFVFGIMKRDATGGINFDGSAELIGEDAASFLTESGFGKVNLVAQAHSKFRARSAVFLSGDRGTFSELRFQGGDFYVVGGINLNPGTKNDIEMTLRFKNVHLEPLASF